MPVPRWSPASTLASRDASGWYAATPRPEMKIATSANG